MGRDAELDDFSSNFDSFMLFSMAERTEKTTYLAPTYPPRRTHHERVRDGLDITYGCTVFLSEKEPSREKE